MNRWSALSPSAGLRLVLAALAILGQILLGTVVPAEAAPTGLTDVICHAPAASGAPGNPTGHHHDDCALCPLCCALAPVAVLSAPPPPLPKPVIILVVREAPVPPATGPPGFSRAIPPPRGPPAQA